MGNSRICESQSVYLVSIHRKKRACRMKHFFHVAKQTTIHQPNGKYKISFMINLLFNLTSRISEVN